MKSIEAQDMSSWSEEDVVALCQKQLPYKLDAYKEILRRHETLVYNTCVKMIGSVPDAEEVCQDAFLQVYHKIHQFEGRAAFKTWLFRIVYNYCLARRKQLAKRRERETAVSEEVGEFLSNAEESQVHDINLSEEIQDAMGRLKEEQRRIIILKYVSGLSLQEIADVLGIGLSAAKMRLYRALDEFKKVYLKVKGEEAATEQQAS